MDGEEELSRIFTEMAQLHAREWSFSVDPIGCFCFGLNVASGFLLCVIKEC